MRLRRRTKAEKTKEIQKEKELEKGKEADIDGTVLCSE